MNLFKNEELERVQMSLDERGTLFLNELDDLDQIVN